MSRIQRPFLLLLLLGFVLGLAQAPAASAEALPFPGNCGITAVGAGETQAEALANALAALKKSYWITSYTVVSSGCVQEELPSVDGNGEIVTVCWAKVNACGFRKFVILT